MRSFPRAKFLHLVVLVFPISLPAHFCSECTQRTSSKTIFTSPPNKHLNIMSRNETLLLVIAVFFSLLLFYLSFSFLENVGPVFKVFEALQRDLLVLVLRTFAYEISWEYYSVLLSNLPPLSLSLSLGGALGPVTFGNRCWYR